MQTFNKKFHNKKIILASGSPRRQELLKGLDIDFSIELKEVDEQYPDTLKAQEITEYLAELKSSAFKNIPENTLIITADTIVWQHEKAVMKPANRPEAIAMLTALSGTSHKVYTSVCIRSHDKKVVFSDCTKVYFEELSTEAISYYVDSYKPYDKAGAYGAQDWIGYVGIKRLEGSYFNVMGLPVHKLYKALTDF